MAGRPSSRATPPSPGAGSRLAPQWNHHHQHQQQPLHQQHAHLPLPPHLAPACEPPRPPSPFGAIQQLIAAGRQPQAAHMASERGASRSPLTWHTPTTAPGAAVELPQQMIPFRHTPTPPDKGAAAFFAHATPPPPSDAANLQQMFNLQLQQIQQMQQQQIRQRGPPFAATMDLSMSSRSPAQNGDVATPPPAPMSLSVRDASKINSLDSSEIVDASRRPAKKVESILERLNRREAPPRSVIVTAPRPTRDDAEATDAVDAPVAARPSEAAEAPPPPPPDPERKESSEAETIDDIAAMIASTEAPPPPVEPKPPERDAPDPIVETLDCDKEVDAKPPAPPDKSDFVEVESELEKMFAGIADEAKNRPKAAVKRRAPRKSKAERRKTAADAPVEKRKRARRKSPGDDEAAAAKKSGRPVAKDSYDSGSNASSNKSRGPYVQIRGPRDSPLSVSVVNAPSHDDDLDRPPRKHRSSKAKVEAPYRGDNRARARGPLHSSTLSAKYDAMTPDASWICVFCKRGPHARPSCGDLFGPYVVSSAARADLAAMAADPRDALFKGGDEPGSFAARKSRKGPRAKRPVRRESEAGAGPSEEAYAGMSEIGDGGAYEVWLHEDCAVWAPGLYLVGSKVVGLDAAVWSCCAVRCDACELLGAAVACVARGCRRTAHVDCARAQKWTLSEDSFSVLCGEHGARSP